MKEAIISAVVHPHGDQQHPGDRKASKQHLGGQHNTPPPPPLSVPPPSATYSPADPDAAAVTIAAGDVRPPPPAPAAAAAATTTTDPEGVTKPAEEVVVEKVEAIAGKVVHFVEEAVQEAREALSHALGAAEDKQARPPALLPWVWWCYLSGLFRLCSQQPLRPSRCASFSFRRARLSALQAHDVSKAVAASGEDRSSGGGGLSAIPHGAVEGDPKEA